MDASVNNGICRCCASEGTFKVLTGTYQWMGEEEVYADMLKECFDIKLTCSEDNREGGICEVCITQLRNASNFKKQVLYTENQLKNRLQDNLFRNSIKVEVPGPDEAVDSDNDNNASDDFSGPEFEVPIKVEVPEESKPKKRMTRAVGSRSKKAKTEHGESSTKRVLRSGGRKIRKSMLRIKKKKDDKKARLLFKSDLMAKHRRNVTAILLNSNATPIFTNTSLGYSCSFCRENFYNPSDLKKHTLEKHNDDEKAKLISEKEQLNRFYVKMDITNLKCTICDSEIDNIEKLLDHFRLVHKINVHTDIDNHCVPFKFAQDILKCCLCPSVFNKFKIILEHMNIHFRNYICDECDAGFITQRKLLAHKSCHKLGHFDCDFCPKSYNTYRKKKLHEKAVHIHFNLLHKCPFCDEKFTGVKSKADHMTAAHGVEKVTVKCMACDKDFKSQHELRIHTKRDHLMERRYKCSDCDMNFFSKHELKEHGVKHSGEKNFQCKICLKSYGRRKTLTEHLRIHSNDRRFKCEFCGQAFVQKCSWVGHMRSKHRERDVL
ncbi:zinc finger protein 611-like isoform X2 [Plodia interpunctella]|uniref:zinc finger protein 611-like isoform X2 n=1 Tax=Plodia interpunctella TaxID=58824 RepID=UPI002368688B|nr:zinc finger protein 611-like isoform X2 [Plodia interpunctella]